MSQRRSYATLFFPNSIPMTMFRLKPASSANDI
ncbi:hypothetical protein BJQ90_02043 [Arthrobacter sp. SO3]|nr:hypothetical protein [Arthrobacter sp. SO3]